MTLFKKVSIFISLLLILILFTLPSQAQTGGGFTLNRSTTDGGGGVSSGGSYTLHGTIGQPDVGPALRGGAYTLVGGFWAGPGAPGGASGSNNQVYLPVLLKN
jgi:hypothetical protein